MLSLKLLLISTSIILTALAFKPYLPLATTHLHLLWTFFLLCFTPPYLFFTLNAIIISILASSNFHQSHTQPNHPILDPAIPSPILDDSPASKYQEVEEVTKEIDLGNSPTKTINSPDNLPMIDKPLVSSRFIHRKPLKSTPEGGKALRVAAKQKRHETLENTWKTITESRSIPLSRHMKKCDTWQNRYEVDPHQPEDSVSDFNLNKTTVRLRKEPSLSQDELNKRVEAFIRNFNHQMRLQREESLNQYLQMINRGGATAS